MVWPNEQVDALLDGCLVLVHRPSGLVFRQVTERAWPELVGRLDGEGQLGAASAAALATSQPSPLAVMFHLLEALLEALHQLVRLLTSTCFGNNVYPIFRWWVHASGC